MCQPVKGIYRQRHPELTAPYRIFEDYYEYFKDIYEEKYQQQYGFFRPIIDQTVTKYLMCGIPRHGFARVRCPNCGNEYLLPFSCKSRICPSCIAKHMLCFQNFFLEVIAQKVPHRHFIFTIPKILRKYFIINRKSLNHLSRMAWESTKEFMQETLDIDGVPGSAQVIQTHGQYLNAHCHIHALVTDGLFTETGTFYKMPKYSDSAKACLQRKFELKVARYCIKKGFVKEETIMARLKWKYTGFSVYFDTAINLSKHSGEEDKEKLEKILRYVSKPFFSMNRVIYKEEGRTVLYKGEYNPVIKQNFETFSPTDFIAAVTAHIPNRHQKYITYYGYYSSKSRGMRVKANQSKIDEDKSIMDIRSPTKEQKAYRKKWAQLLKQVFEADPLLCPECHHEMRILSIIYQPSTIRKILEHLGQWNEKNNTRAPPDIEYEEIKREPFFDGWELNEEEVKYAA